MYRAFSHAKIPRWSCVAPSSLSHSLSHVAAIGLGSALKTLRLTHLASLYNITVPRCSAVGSRLSLDKMAACLLTLAPPPPRLPPPTPTLRPLLFSSLPPLLLRVRGRVSLSLSLSLSRHRRSANHEAPSTPCESRRQRGSQIAAPLSRNDANDDAY